MQLQLQTQNIISVLSYYLKQKDVIYLKIVTQRPIN